MWETESKAKRTVEEPLHVPAELGSNKSLEEGYVRVHDSPVVIPNGAMPETSDAAVSSSGYVSKHDVVTASSTTETGTNSVSGSSDPNHTPGSTVVGTLASSLSAQVASLAPNAPSAITNIGASSSSAQSQGGSASASSSAQSGIATSPKSPAGSSHDRNTPTPHSSSLTSTSVASSSTSSSASSTSSLSVQSSQLQSTVSGTSNISHTHNTGTNIPSSQSHSHPIQSQSHSPQSQSQPPSQSQAQSQSHSHSHSISHPLPPVPTGGESIYRTIMNRLTTLEANTTLYTRYVDEQISGVREVLRRLGEDVGRLDGLVSSFFVSRKKESNYPIVDNYMLTRVCFLRGIIGQGTSAELSAIAVRARQAQTEARVRA